MASADLETTELLSVEAGDLPDLCGRDEELLKQSMRGKLLADEADYCIALVPDLATMQWHHAGEEFSAMNLRSNHPTAKGASASTGSGKVWCLWTRAFDEKVENENILHILRLVIDD